MLSAQGFAYGFGRFRMRRLAEGPQAEPLSRVDALLVVSGSAAPLTARQIGAFAEEGAATVRLEASRSLDPASADAALDARDRSRVARRSRGAAACASTPRSALRTRIRRRCARSPSACGSTMPRSPGGSARRSERLHSGSSSATASPASPSPAATPRAMRFGGWPRRASPSPPAITRRAPMSCGSPARPPIEGLEITLKGGQVGDEGFFVTLRDGRAGSRP